MKKMHLLKNAEVPGTPIWNFKRARGIPLLKFEGVPGGPLWNFWGFSVPFLIFEISPSVLVVLLHLVVFENKILEFLGKKPKIRRLIKFNSRKGFLYV